MPFPLLAQLWHNGKRRWKTVPVKLQDLVVADGTRIAEVVDASLRCASRVDDMGMSENGVYPQL